MTRSFDCWLRRTSNGRSRRGMQIFVKQRCASTWLTPSKLSAPSRRRSDALRLHGRMEDQAGRGERQCRGTEADQRGHDDVPRCCSGCGKRQPRFLARSPSVKSTTDCSTIRSLKFTKKDRVKRNRKGEIVKGHPLAVQDEARRYANDESMETKAQRSSTYWRGRASRESVPVASHRR